MHGTWMVEKLVQRFVSLRYSLHLTYKDLRVKP
jgi:hypothetical protein